MHSYGTVSLNISNVENRFISVEKVKVEIKDLLSLKLVRSCSS